MKLIQTINDPARNLVKRAMDFTVQIAPLAWTANLAGSLFFMEAAMQNKNQGQEACDDLTDIQVQARIWEERQKSKDSQRFREFVRQMRQRCGLEANYA